eukprot:1492739-Ditylum_brightwellii.AAC.1
MKKGEATKLSRWELAVSEKYGEFLKKLAALTKEKGRMQSVLKVLWEFVSDEMNAVSVADCNSPPTYALENSAEL